MDRPLLEMRNISKSFGKFKALDDVSLTVARGEVLGLIGENGAGKSTLMKILSGAYTKDAGEIYIDGEKADIDSVKSSQAAGVSIIYQELSLLNTLNITENIFINREQGKAPRMGVLDTLDRKSMNKKATEIMRFLGVEENVKTCVNKLTLPQKQMVEIARALEADAKIIIMDEPTAALEQKERDILFDIIRKLKAEGVGIIFVSHALEELMLICDRVQVLRDGKNVGIEKISDISVDHIITLMIGKEIKEKYIKRPVELGEEILRVEGLSDGKSYNDISFRLRRGEIIGFAGLDGCGKNQVCRKLFGIGKKASGTIIYNNKEYTASSPNEAIRKKVAFLPSDRKSEGILANEDIRWNISIANLNRVWRKFSLQKGKESKEVHQLMKALNVKAQSMFDPITSMSGGNQQKALVARWLFADSQLIIMEEPTRGIDVNAKTEIYEYIMQCVEAGKSVIVISSETEELMGICDRILVMNKGKLVAELDVSETSQNEIKQYSVNLENT